MEFTFIGLTCCWLVLCAIQDWRGHEVSNVLTLPVLGASLLWRLMGWGRGSFFSLFCITILLLLVWRKGWIGGADLKASLAIALFDLCLFGWAWIGVLLWYLISRFILQKGDMHRMTGFPGFAVGAFLFLIWRVSGG